MIQVDETNPVSTPPVTVAAAIPDVPKFLVEWSSPWAEFWTAIGPAFGKSPRKLAGEARTGLFPYRGILVSWVAEALALVAVIVIPTKLRILTPFQPPPQPKYDVIYYSGDELPRVEDAGGAQTGRSGRAGGKEAFHHTQTIRVARGASLRDQIVDAPNIKLPVSNSAVANLLAYKPIPGPPPAAGLKSSLRASNAPQMQVAAPAPSVQAQMLRAAPVLSNTVVAPSPAAPRRDLAALQVPGSRMRQVVPPPVSAPERVTIPNPKLTLPAQLVVAPPPAEIPRELSPRGPGFGAGELQRQVVPPAVQLSNGTVRNGTGTSLSGNVAVAPPTVQMSNEVIRSGMGRSLNGTVAVAPPTVQISNASTSRQGPATLGGNVAVVAPPVQLSTGAARNGRGTSLNGNVPVVAPPVQMANGALSRNGGMGLGGNVAVAAPAPSLPGAGALSGHGQGLRGSGFGGRGDSGDVMAPPKGGGAGGGNGIVVSSKPGSQVGLPGGGGAGSLAMSPKGGNDPGLGGSGGGNSIGHGNGPGSGFSGAGSGAGKDGPGRGSDPNARAGISPYPGPGGAGSGVNGTPAMAGVSVRGGSNNIVTLPSFGENGDPPTDLTRSTGKDKRGGVTVVATSRSGGAFNRYGYLKGDKVYTIYLDTTVGPAVMQLADPLSAAKPASQELTAPEPLRTDLPAGILHSRLVIACTLDRNGMLKNFQVLEPGDATMTARVLAALPRWKFRSAMRGDQPVEVTAILGFNVDTTDHY